MSIGEDLTKVEYEILCHIKAMCVEDIVGNMVDEAHDREHEDQIGLIEARLEMIEAVMKAPDVKSTIEAYWQELYSCPFEEVAKALITRLYEEGWPDKWIKYVEKQCLG